MGLQIVELKFASTAEEVECKICSILSSDITLFEKISSATYRLRINAILKKAEEFQSDTEDSGAVDDDLCESDAYSSEEDSRCDAGNLSLGKARNLKPHKSKDETRNVCTEIDESHSGEAWLLGLMEGEYSDLSIEEKLNAMVALTDLVRAGSSIREEVLHRHIRFSKSELPIISASINLTGEIKCFFVKKIHSNYDAFSKIYCHSNWIKNFVHAL